MLQIRFSFGLAAFNTSSQFASALLVHSLMGKESGREFADTIFGRHRNLDVTEATSPSFVTEFHICSAQVFRSLLNFL